MSLPFFGSAALSSGLLTRGQLRWNYIAIHPDVYITKGSEPALELRTHAAALWVPGGIIAGRAAAALHGARWMAAATPIELIGRARRPQAGVIVREERISACDVCRMRSPAGGSRCRDLRDGRDSRRSAAMQSISRRSTDPTLA